MTDPNLPIENMIPGLRDRPMETYIFIHSGNGRRIATARDTIPALFSNHSLTLMQWYQLEAHKMGVEISKQVGPEKVRARILFGRWLVDCPVCNGANDVIPAEPIYLCSCCLWPGIFWMGNPQPPHFAEVIFPADRGRIESILVNRPYIHNRNWHPGESIERLMEENRQLEGEV